MHLKMERSVVLLYCFCLSEKGVLVISCWTGEEIVARLHVFILVTGQMELFMQGQEKAILEENDTVEDHDPAVVFGEEILNG